MPPSLDHLHMLTQKKNNTNISYSKKCPETGNFSFSKMNQKWDENDWWLGKGPLDFMTSPCLGAHPRALSVCSSLLHHRTEVLHRSSYRYTIMEPHETSQWDTVRYRYSYKTSGVFVCFIGSPQIRLSFFPCLHLPPIIVRRRKEEFKWCAPFPKTIMFIMFRWICKFWDWTENIIFQYVSSIFQVNALTEFLPPNSFRIPTWIFRLKILAIWTLRNLLCNREGVWGEGQRQYEKCHGYKECQKSLLKRKAPNLQGKAW